MPTETIELRGHIIDSLILPKVLDEILSRGGEFKLVEIRIGEQRVDQSFARIEVQAATPEALSEILLRLRQHGGEVVGRQEVQLAPAPRDGVFPDDFYVTTNQQTFVQLDGREIAVESPMLDSGIAVDRAQGKARSVKFADIRKGDAVVVGHAGVRVQPAQRTRERTDVFQFNHMIAAEMPKGAVIREVAQEMQRLRAAQKKILVVAGPSVVQTGAGERLEKLIELGYVQRLFTGNGLAVYDVESALYGTSLGVDLADGALRDDGHQNHMRAINRIRQAGGIREAVEEKILTRGIMAACVRQGTDIVLAGSIRDDGPLPGVITDSVEAQRIMREKLRDISLVLMLGSMLHSIAVVNLLPASVRMVCVDIAPRVVARLTSDHPFQAVGLVTDVEPFLRELLEDLAQPAAGGAARTR